MFGKLNELLHRKKQPVLPLLPDGSEKTKPSDKKQKESVLPNHAETPFQTPTINAYGITDRGLNPTRPVNQDTLYAKHFKDSDADCLIVADGIGGYMGGAEAARFVTHPNEGHSIPERIEAGLSKLDANGLKNDKKILDVLKNAIIDTNRDFLSQKQFIKDGSGVVVVVAVILNNNAYIVWAGDSRAYHIDNETHELTRLTTDDSTVQELVKAKMITDEESYNHPRRNEVSRSIGSEITDKDGDIHCVYPSSSSLQNGDVV